MVHESRKLLLVGRTGNGKSSTGNSIAGEQRFTVYSSGEQEVDTSPKVYSNESLTIVDGTGIGDTGKDSIGGTTAAIVSRNSALKLCDYVITALIFVLKYGVRFTKQEKDAVLRVKALLGENIFKANGIIVMTFGDNFKPDDENKTFESWCGQQSGDFSRLLAECGFRCVLFNNRSKEKAVQDEQRKCLFKCIGQLPTPYTLGHYRNAEVSFEEIGARLKAFKQRSKQINENPRDRIYTSEREYRDALKDLRAHMLYLEELDNNTHLLRDSIDWVKNLIATLEKELERFRSQSKIARNLRRVAHYLYARKTGILILVGVTATLMYFEYNPLDVLFSVFRYVFKWYSINIDF